MATKTNKLPVDIEKFLMRFKSEEPISPTQVMVNGMVDEIGTALYVYMTTPRSMDTAPKDGSCFKLIFEVHEEKVHYMRCGFDDLEWWDNGSDGYSVGSDIAGCLGWLPPR